MRTLDNECLLDELHNFVLSALSRPHLVLCITLQNGNNRPTGLMSAGRYCWLCFFFLIK